MDSVRKRCKYTKKDNTDRISNLPKELLCHILSFLPTKYAAGTSILSTKWKNLLPLIPNLQLQLEDTHLLHPHPPSNTHITTFQNFAHNLLNFTLADTPSIHSLTLICHKIDNGRLIASWINAALRLNIKRMDIQIQQLQNHKFLLDSLYRSNLVFLNLDISFSYDVTEFKFSLPKLKKLCVHRMGFTHVNALLASCPVLKYLTLINCHCFHPKERLQIHIPSLVYLNLVNDLCWVNYVVELEAPQLLCLSHCGYISTRNVIGRREDVWISYVNYENNSSQYAYYYDEQAAMLMKACSAAETLWLSEKFISAMYCHPHRPPRFQRMINLSKTDMNAHGWELLPSLIKSAPNDFDNERFESFEALVMDFVSARLLKHAYRFFPSSIERKEN